MLCDEEVEALVERRVAVETDGVGHAVLAPDEDDVARVEARPLWEGKERFHVIADLRRAEPRSSRERASWENAAAPVVRDDPEMTP